MTDTFERKTFSISRLAEFVSESELVKQIGHPVRDWSLVIVKELVDNALDEAEEAGSPPTIQIHVDAPEDEPGEIIVHDGGRGIPAETVEKLIGVPPARRAARPTRRRPAAPKAMRCRPLSPCLTRSPARTARPW